ncbi:hypothetical protein BG006_002280 [Podila minutissima]|uniref:Uncharacterized protein n=1 Tax=Podila minutissima TaxID=64525 RepID=A0A9P5SSI5_9FUNG|nr:hypothetical protein BG006_002280 [Podila minutissima]
MLTVGGVDYYLAEIRNIVKTQDDVSRLWPNCDPKDIQILGFDLGQAFVAGVSALLPSSTASAVLTEQKRIVPPGASASIQDIESNLPPLHGEDLSVVSYVKDLE